MANRKLDIKDARMCASCGKTPFKNIDLYVVEISQGFVNERAIREFVGMTIQLDNNPALADMFVGNRTLAELMPAMRVLICHDCFLTNDHSLAAYWEKAYEEEKERKEEEEKTA